MDYNGPASFPLLLILILEIATLCLAQSLETVFYNDTVLNGGQVELRIIKYSPKELISLLCGVNSDKTNYGFISSYDKEKEGLIPFRNVRSEYSGRIFIKEGWTTVISNITVRDEGRYFYCSMAVNVEGDSVQHNGFKHQLKSVQERPRMVGKILRSSTNAKENSSLVLQCHYEGRPLLNASWSGSLSKVGTHNTTLRITNYLHHVTISLYISKVEAAFNALVGFCSTMNDFGSGTQWTRLNVTYAPKNTSLTVNKRLGGKVVNITISCRAVANPRPFSYLVYMGRVLVKKSVRGVYLLSTSNCTFITFSCVPINAIGKGQQSSTTVDTSRLPSITLLKKRITLNEGQTLSIQCLANGCPTPQIWWYKNNEIVARQSNLIIKDITPQDQGNYTCIAKNQQGSADKSIYVDIRYTPRDTSLTVSQNQHWNGFNITIHCKAKANPSITYFLFYRDGVFVRKSTSKTFWLFTFRCIVSNFTCIPVNSLGNGPPVSSTITTLKSPSIFPLSRKIILKENQTLSISCFANGCPAPQILWYRDNKVVGIQPNLTIKEITPENQGNYTCVAKNQIGSVKRSTIVEICCKNEVQNSEGSSIKIVVSIVVSCSIAVLLGFLCIIVAWKKLKRRGHVFPTEGAAQSKKGYKEDLLLQMVATTNGTKD